MGTVNHNMIIPALRGERSKSARVNGDRIMACLSDQDGADPSFMPKGLPLSKKVKEYASLVTHFLPFFGKCVSQRHVHIVRCQCQSLSVQNESIKELGQFICISSADGVQFEKRSITSVLVQLSVN